MFHLSTHKLKSAHTSTATRHIKPLTIIIGLGGIFFEKWINNPLLAPNTYACTLKPINPSASLRLLHDFLQHGHKLLSATTLSQETLSFLEAIPQTAQLFSYFDEILCTETLALQDYNERVIHHLIKHNALDPRLCIVIDDQPEVLQSARQAGITKTILCTDSNFSDLRKKLRLYGAL